MRPFCMRLSCGRGCCDVLAAEDVASMLLVTIAEVTACRLVFEPANVCEDVIREIQL